MSDILPVLRRMAQQQGEDYIWRTAQSAADEIERLRNEVTILRSALEPFAKDADFWPAHLDSEALYAYDPDNAQVEVTTLTVSKLRLARAAFNGTQGS